MASNMYLDVESINPMGGLCLHKCEYCSSNNLRARWAACSIKYSGPYRLYEKELRKFKKHYGKVFVCGQNDLFEAHVPSEIIMSILNYINEHGHPDNTYMFQSKDPILMQEYASGMTKTCHWGTTIETNDESIVLSEAPPTSIRRNVMRDMKESGQTTYITIEPIVKFQEGFAEFIAEAKPDYVFIGADSKNNNLPEPTKGQIYALIHELRYIFNIKVKLKENLNRLLPEGLPDE